MEIKALCYKNIDNIKEYIKNIAEKIYKNPETGFKEFKTSELVKGEFEKLGLTYNELDDIPGIKATIDTKKEGPEIAIIGELDAVICREHMDSDGSTGAVHACGHNIMISNMLGVAKSLLDDKILDSIVGKIHFIAVPAEEYIELDYRIKLMNEGVIKYPTGKAELLHRGVFDGIDICIMMHVMPGENKIGLESGSNGFIAKKARFIGRSSHAASSPENGINSLYAANLALMGINASRETLRDESNVRIHPIITKGGDAVNVIPSDVEVETLIRANNVDDIKDASIKVNRALLGGAISVGAFVEIQDTPGMLPLIYNEELTKLAEKIGRDLVDKCNIVKYKPSKGSTDLGDISSLVPAIEVCVECIDGGLHTSSYKINNEDYAYVISSKILGGMAIELLESNAKKAYQIIDKYEPIFKNKNEYFDFMDRFNYKQTVPDKDFYKSEL